MRRNSAHTCAFSTSVEPFHNHIIPDYTYLETRGTGEKSGGLAPARGLIMEPNPPASEGITAKAAALESILEVTTHFLYVENLDQLLDKIAKTVSETFGVARCHIGIREEDTGLFAIRATHGYDPEREAQIRKVKYTMARMNRDLKPELKIGKTVYYVPFEMSEFDDDDMIFVDYPERLDRARVAPDDWHELDYIDFLMYKRDGSLLGYLEIDEPDNNKVPSDDTLRAVEIFSGLASIAIQNAELYSNLEKDRRKIGVLVDLIGHDINNYVQAVSGFVELAMARPGVPEPSRKSLGKALDQVWNLIRLVSDVKLYARVEATSDKELRPMDLVAVIKDAFKAAESGSPNRNVKLLVSDEKTPRFCDMNDLAKEIFVNLFSNAIKFDEHDEVRIEVEIDSYWDDKREMLCVSVADRGPGVDDDIKERIFDRFTQSASTTKGGSGLGLYIAKTLVELYKGRIWVEDREKGDRSKGSIFKVGLPKAT